MRRCRNSVPRTASSSAPSLSSAAAASAKLRVSRKRAALGALPGSPRQLALPERCLSSSSCSRSVLVPASPPRSSAASAAVQEHTFSMQLESHYCNVIDSAPELGCCRCDMPDVQTLIAAEQRLPVLLATSSIQAASLLAASPSAARAAVTAPNMSTHTCAGEVVMHHTSKAGASRSPVEVETTSA